MSVNKATQGASPYLPFQRGTLDTSLPFHSLLDICNLSFAQNLRKFSFCVASQIDRREIIDISRAEPIPDSDPGPSCHGAKRSWANVRHERNPKDSPQVND